MSEGPRFSTLSTPRTVSRYASIFGTATSISSEPQDDPPKVWNSQQGEVKTRSPNGLTFLESVNSYFYRYSTQIEERSGSNLKILYTALHFIDRTELWERIQYRSEFKRSADTHYLAIHHSFPHNRKQLVDLEENILSKAMYKSLQRTEKVDQVLEGIRKRIVGATAKRLFPPPVGYERDLQSNQSTSRKSIWKYPADDVKAPSYNEEDGYPVLVRHVCLRCSASPEIFIGIDKTKLHYCPDCGSMLDIPKDEKGTQNQSFAKPGLKQKEKDLQPIAPPSQQHSSRDDTPSSRGSQSVPTPPESNGVNHVASFEPDRNSNNWSYRLPPQPFQPSSSSYSQDMVMSNVYLHSNQQYLEQRSAYGNRMPAPTSFSNLNDAARMQNERELQMELDRQNGLGKPGSKWGKKGWTKAR